MPLGVAETALPFARTYLQGLYTGASKLWTDPIEDFGGTDVLHGTYQTVHHRCPESRKAVASFEKWLWGFMLLALGSGFKVKLFLEAPDLRPPESSENQQKTWRLERPGNA